MITRLKRILFIFILILFSLGQLQRLQLTKVIAFYLHDLFLLGWLGLSFIYDFPQWQNQLKKILHSKLVLVTMVWIGLGWLVNFILQGFSVLPLLYFARALTYAAFGLSLSFSNFFSRKSQLWCWMISGLGIAGLGFAQYFLLPDTRFLRYWGWDDHYFRLLSTHFDPNFTGILLVSTFFLVLKFIQERGKIWPQVIYLAGLSLALLLTYSRASYLSFLFSIIFLLILQRFSKRIKLSSPIKIKQKLAHSLVSLVILFILAIPFLPRPAGEGVKLERVASIKARVRNNHSALQKQQQYQWLMGQGLFSVNSTDSDSFWPDTAHFPDNIFVWILSSTGIIGLMIGLFILYKSSLFLYEKDVFIFYAFFAILIHSQFNHTLFQPFVWLWFSGVVFSLNNGN
jgi:hypothetical protein